MRVYLAARYSRRIELCDYRDDLLLLGHTVVCRWLDGHHELFGDATAHDLQEHRDNLDNPTRANFAHEDLMDLLGAEAIIAFTEKPRETTTRGGRHIEFGVALGTSKKLFVVGPKENIFYSLPEVNHFDTWFGCLNAFGTPSASHRADKR